MNLEEIEKIVSMEVEDISWHDDVLIELFLKEIYYYTLEDNKEIEVENTLKGIYDFICTLLNALYRKTDLLDAIYLIRARKYSSDGSKNNYIDAHFNLLCELNGNKRTFDDLEDLYNKTISKISEYSKNLAK